MARDKIYVSEERVVCDGADSSHPRIYLQMPESGKVTCPYCSRLFIKRSD
jgi:uncharacterized Zn-finger protein